MLTLREAATLQTFPPDFRFLGNRSEIATLIGNAIPPRFAQALGAAVMASLQQPEVDDEGYIHHFVVTHAEALSPALARTVALVENRYRHASEAPALF